MTSTSEVVLKLEQMRNWFLVDSWLVGSIFLWNIYVDPIVHLHRYMIYSLMLHYTIYNIFFGILSYEIYYPPFFEGLKPAGPND